MATEFLLLASLLGAFSAPRVHGAPVPVKIDYEVRLEDLSQGRLHIAMRVSRWKAGALLLRGVPFYAGNPTPKAIGETVLRLRISDAFGRQMNYEQSRDPRGQWLFRLPGARGEVTVEYTLVVRFEDSAQTSKYPILIPFMNSDRAWLYGNCVFLHPEAPSPSGQTLWEPAEVTLRFDLPAEVPLVGVPGKQMALGNLWQLMSLQFGLGNFVVEPLETEGIRLQLIYRSTGEFGDGEREVLRSTTSRLVRAAVRLFGGAPFDRFGFLFYRGDNNRFSGLEGTYSCQTSVGKDISVAVPSEPPSSYFYTLVAHEFFHSWNPLSFVAIEDPWVKEGLTEYYGNVLGARLGYIPREKAERSFRSYFSHLANNPLMNNIPLTNPRIRQENYTDENWRTVTYERGQAVALLLDVLIREKTQNRRSLDDVMRGLFQTYRGRGFSHRQFLETIREQTGVDVSRLFAIYVEGKKAPPEALVKDSLRKAIQLGIFE